MGFMGIVPIFHRIVYWIIATTPPIFRGRVFLQTKLSVFSIEVRGALTFGSDKIRKQTVLED